MKRIAIITLAVALENEKGYSRFRSLAEILSKKYSVDIITSSFQHWEKRQRDTNKLLEDNKKKKYGIKFAYEPGYKKNVDLKRLLSHRIAVKNILKILIEQNYNLLYCIIPDNAMAAKVAKYAKLNNIKLIIDIEDLWPEVMQMVFKVPKIVDYFIFYFFRKNALIAYQSADGIIGTSDEYRDIPKDRYGITIENRKTVYVGCDLDDFDAGVKEFVDEIDKGENEFWVTYAGNLGSSYDIPTLVRAAQKLYIMGEKDIKIKILGGGPLESEFKTIKREKTCNVEFVGYTPYKKMAAYLFKSDITINSFVKKAPQSIVTKIGDYLAAGKPMINTCSSQEFRDKVERDGFGINLEAENIELLANSILELYRDYSKCEEMGKKARKIAEEQFDRKMSYKVIEKMISELVS